MNARSGKIKMTLQVDTCRELPERSDTDGSLKSSLTEPQHHLHRSSGYQVAGVTMTGFFKATMELEVERLEYSKLKPHKSHCSYQDLAIYKLPR